MYDMTDAVQAMKNRAVAMNGQSVAVNLSGGQTLTGTLTYATITGSWGGTVYPEVLTVTVASKAHVVRIDHVSSLGQG
ncbi:hypothetical protein AB0M05_39045 [Streptomyces violaceusniger]|uniref:hypothetical protein n=1 Tax=Streptomyces violaceusniger TaxID=68280 RepID=UPI003414CB45